MVAAAPAGRRLVEAGYAGGRGGGGGMLAIAVACGRRPAGVGKSARSRGLADH